MDWRNERPTNGKEQTRYMAKTMFASGHTMAEVQLATGKGSKTLRRYRNRDSIFDKPRSGRPLKFNEDQKLEMIGHLRNWEVK